MNTSTKVLLGLVAVVLVASIAFLFGATLTRQSGPLGATNATTSYNSAGQQNSVYLWELAAAGDLSTLRAPLAGLVTSSTGLLTFGSVASSGAPLSTTTVLSIPAQIGDLVFVEPVGTSSPGIAFQAAVNVASTTAATFSISASLVSGTAAITPGVSNFQITVLPRASFVAPGALNVSTTSAPYNP